jgi:site-specific recombinase XerD
MLRVEKNLSPNSISAYKSDLEPYLDFLSNKQSLFDEFLQGQLMIVY